MAIPRLLLLLLGDTYPDISRDHGEYEAWFAEALQGGAELTAVKVFQGEPIPEIAGFDGLLVSGSPSSVTAWEGWMDAASAVVEAAVDQGLPIFGVCFGHQLLAHVLGGKVTANPRGREIGTVQVHLTGPGHDDPVLGPQGAAFHAQATHVDAVVEPPPGATVLARTDRDGCSAYRVGERAYGVQFHPEITAPIIRRYIHLRARDIDGEAGTGTAARLAAAVADTPETAALLQRFVSMVVAPAARRRRPAARRAKAPTARRDGLYQEHALAAEDGNPVCYNRIGHGDPPLLLCAGIGCNQYAWKYLVPALRRRHTIVRWNYPGHGRTPPPAGWQDKPSRRLSIHGMADEAVRVMDHAGLDRAVLCGHSMGVQVVLETWHRHRDRVLGMVLMCGSYGRPLDTFHDSAAAALAFPYVQRLAQAFPGPARRLWRTVLNHDLAYAFATAVEVNGRLLKRPDFQPYFDDIAQVDPLLFLEMLRHAAAHTAEPYLADIAVPTLVVAGERDTFTPHSLSQHMHRAIPRSELLTVPTGTHTAPIEIPELVNLRVERFLDAHFPPLLVRLPSAAPVRG